MSTEVFGITIVAIVFIAAILQYHYHNNTALGLTRSGWQRLGKRDFEGALSYFDRALEKNPEFVWAYQGRATTYLQSGNEDGALADCQRIIDLDPTKLGDMLLTRALAYNNLGKAGEAISDFTRIIEKNPRDAVVYESRASAYQKLNRIQDALADLNYLVEELGEKSFSIFTERALIHHKLKNYAAAIDDFNAVLQYEIPENMRYNTYLLLAVGYLHLKRYEEGFATANRMIEIAPDKQDGYFQRGQVYLDRGEFEKALADYQQALALEPHNTAYYEPMATCYFNMGQTSEALDAINKFIPAMPDYAPGYRIRGLIYMRLNQRTDAIADFTHYLETYPDNALINNNIAWLKSFLGQYGEALEHINKAIECVSDSATVYDTRGQVYWLMDNYEAALADYEQAQNLDNTHVGFQAGKIVTLFSLGRKDEAIAAWQQIQAREDGLTTAEALQDKYGYAPPFYAAMQQVEALAKGE